MCNSLGRIIIKESYRIELLLQFLIGVVDAELLKTVNLKCLKPVGNDKKMNFLLSWTDLIQKPHYTLLS